MIKTQSYLGLGALVILLILGSSLWLDMDIVQSYRPKTEFTNVPCPEQQSTQNGASKEIVEKKEEKKKEEQEEGEGEEEEEVDPCVSDPLSDACDDSPGYPEKPLTVSQVELCSPILHANLPHGRKELECQDDHSCVKCRPKYQKMKSFLDAFRDKNLQKKREKVFQEKFTMKDEKTGKVKKKSVVVVGMNYGQVYLFLNWVCSCHSIGLDPTEFTYIIPTDPKTYYVVTNHGFTAEPLKWLENSGNSIDDSYKGLANVGPHTYINAMIAAGTEALVVAGYPAFLMDVDVVWLKNVFDLLHLVTNNKNRDIVGSFSPRDDAYGYVNGGAVYFVPTKKTKTFISTFVNVNAIKSGSDQVLLNSMLRYHKFRQLNLAIAPQYLINTHWSRSRLKNIGTSLPYLAHTVGVDKGKRFQTLGLWFFNKTCSQFDKGVLEDALERNLLDPP